MTEERLLVPLEDYLKAGIHIGTKYKCKYMEPFIYKSRSDGLLVLNVQEVNKRLEMACKMISQYNPKEILIVCRRENGWHAVKLFSEVTGIRSFAGRYPPGILTNRELNNFIEIKLMIVVDPWPDKNAVKDALDVNVPVIALCDTNNESNKLDLVVPCNNKGKKSLGLIFWIFANEYLKTKNKKLEKTIDDFTAE
jgi:small subunit ribosomal protein S2